MYEKYFNFSANPFKITPNPRYLYLTDRHREALAHLSYGLQENGGFILLTGEVGTGKTTVCRCLLERVPEHVDLAMILTPTLGARELLESICQEFGIETDSGATEKALTDALNRYLLDTHAKGRRAVVLIDEAQNLDVKVLEQLRLLTNLETNESKLLQIILVAQPEFLDKLESPELRQLSQRIVARFHLAALKPGEVHGYINHRLKISGSSSAIFSPAVALRIGQLSKGIPRLINLLCDRALLGCYVQDRSEVDMQTLRQAAREVFGEPVARQRTRRLRSPYLPWFAGAGAVAVALVLFLGGGLQQPVPAWWQAVSQGVGKATGMVAGIPESPGEDEGVSGSPDYISPGGQASPGVAEPSLEVAEEPVVAVVPERPPAPLDADSLAELAPTEVDAYRSLFGQWDMSYFPDSGKTPCQLATENQLDCWHRDGNFSDLQRLNRPVILKMVSRAGKLFYVALLTVDNGVFYLGAGDRKAQVSFDEFQRLWTNEFTILWKRPGEFVRTLRPGDKNDLVVWLDQRMSLFDGRKVGLRQPRVYDFGLSRRVRTLQRRCGLVVDGLVGRETVIAINGLTASVPLLSERFGSQCKRRLGV